MNFRTMHRPAIALALLALVACQKEQPAGGDAATSTDKGEENIVVLSDESLANLDLGTEEAKLGVLNQTLKVPGRIVVDGNRTAKVSAQFEGRLSKLTRDLGDRVVSGAEMGAVETPELLDRPFVLRAPIPGVVTEKTAAVGELVAKGQSIFTVSDLASVWLIGEVKEKDVSLVKIGQKVAFRVMSYPDEVFHGRIARVGSSVESDTRTFEIRVEVANKAGRLKPGMFADVEITTEVVRKALLVGDASLETEGGKQIVFVAQGKGRFEKRIVEIGHEQDGRMQVLSGVGPGEIVVTEGSFALKSELLKSELGED
jgi:multidrug efflux pump subunit AcrA (membrane-fusion protein)